VPATGELVSVHVEKPAAGGRMLARHDGQVVLVAGAIPGEHVSATIEREHRGVLYAVVEHVLAAHPARRVPDGDPACGGASYAHIQPDHQRQLKADIIVDAFRRIGKLPIEATVSVTASPERGYRLRARLHLREGRLGSFREGTHTICDYSQTGQLSDEANGVIRAVALELEAFGVREIDSIELTENLSGDQRVLHFEGSGSGPLEECLRSMISLAGITGVTRSGEHGRSATVNGNPCVADRLDAFIPALDSRSAGLPLQRHARSFFQANRFLTPTLVQRVLSMTRPGALADLYAGVGLFAVCAAAAGQKLVVAVEGDRSSMKDLRRNAAPFRGHLEVEDGAVEGWLARRHHAKAATLIVDPPRTGMSREAMDGVLKYGAERVVYVSCDVATAARDAGRIVTAGYTLTHIEAFDLFPNTPHIESLAVFDRR
jgi:tRNA/tmRNA/rRNA uracil-C5-methylase (TrmA/RlmC/RlmD family)